MLPSGDGVLWGYGLEAQVSGVSQGPYSKRYEVASSPGSLRGFTSAEKLALVALTSATASLPDSIVGCPGASGVNTSTRLAAVSATYTVSVEALTATPLKLGAPGAFSVSREVPLGATRCTL